MEHTNNDHELHTCLRVARNLTAMAQPPGNGSRYDMGPQTLTLSSTQSEAVYPTTARWLESAEEVSKHLSSAGIAKLRGWLKTHTDAIRSKIDDGDALYFDAFLLGIVPVDLHCLMNLVQSEEAQKVPWPSPWDLRDEYGFGDLHQVQYTFNVVRNVIQGYLVDVPQDKRISIQRALNNWQSQTSVLHDSHDTAFNSLPVLQQYGIKEMAYFFLHTLQVEVKKGSAAQTIVLNLLQNWTPSIMLQRAQITIEMARRCATLETSTGITLQAASSNADHPTYFHPLSLPPANPNWHWHGDELARDIAEGIVSAMMPPTHHSRQLPRPVHHLLPELPRPGQPLLPPDAGSAGLDHYSLTSPLRHTAHPHQHHLSHTHPGPHELGSESFARMGRRAARIYGINRREWQDQHTQSG